MGWFMAQPRLGLEIGEVARMSRDGSLGSCVHASPVRVPNSHTALPEKPLNTPAGIGRSLAAWPVSRSMPVYDPAWHRQGLPSRMDPMSGGDLC